MTYFPCPNNSGPACVGCIYRIGLRSNIQPKYHCVYVVDSSLLDVVHSVHLVKRFGGAPPIKILNENKIDDFEKTRPGSRCSRIGHCLPVLTAGGRTFREGTSPNHWHARFTERDHDH